MTSTPMIATSAASLIPAARAVLRLAAARIEDGGWTAHADARDANGNGTGARDPRAVVWSAWGAIGADSGFGEAGAVLAHAAALQLCEVIGLGSSPPRHAARCVVGWEDHTNLTGAEVVAALRAAATVGDRGGEDERGAGEGGTEGGGRMSAYVVDRTHIAALVGAAQKHRIHWFARIEEGEDEGETHTAGLPWGPDAMSQAERRRRRAVADTLNEVAWMLHMTNRRSVAYRYDEPIEAELPGSCVEREVPWTEGECGIGRNLHAMVLLKAVHGYEYQSCEHPGWEGSEALAFCRSLTRALITELPGYSEAPGWEISNPVEVLLWNPPGAGGAVATGPSATWRRGE